MSRIATKQSAALATIFISICVYILIVYISRKLTSSSASLKIALESKNREIIEYVRQRNNISRLLNLKQQLIGQMECEKITEGVATSSTGGWCAKISVEDSGQHVTDRKIIPALAKIFTGKAVASFGDGPGRYKQLLLDTGKLKSYDAFDGAPFSEETSEGRVDFLDLSIPQYGLPLYDWILCLEVAEHIPQQYEHIFIDNIIRHAREGVVLSWCFPGPGGYGHVNGKPFQYVKELLESVGFMHDQDESKKLQQATELSWLKTNTNVYRRKDLNKEVDHKLLQNA